ncbi:divergent PAP2 family protein [bacterium (Candidatus Blackallbacteria) CG17_big_fil_post_rev_8_21_14_2_50_48_46]|uniref:Divergent PAP2 family protein n=1 Tax=bacterium (Candidatus Blackallbacteria) CG17_big_fil_post_rev_8_21_14_2_50_48_46 TaxID=2014261 RepID=A0A2M7GA57_9BACT|nr:MAG: acid phosphatase [bacterium (Candidatus Blackallbacteria) CG18_big_fil_WC_8_21_14_2_50_49_26]PIW19025.1 MAG: divergent PAP2 family protein [bacterium (Candidatus Blackallbacteria) CG17_big_fil_post_rev_8_21_14_2_50_48_46]PIW44607.1 MAG: divergent PAP2 family protein [bacterium (Candidatus Blackallbacteria) CG13_big_fil_rev_8_21_14_2_50_49_14]
MSEILGASLFAMLFAQFLKLFTSLLQNRKLNLMRFVESGGMPSSHTAFVVCLSCSIGIVDGWQSSTFAIAVTFALIVMYDATGVRRAAGLQARVLNQIIDELEKGHMIQDKRLKELLGHTPKEVLAGAVLGLLVAFVFNTPVPLVP